MSIIKLKKNFENKQLVYCCLNDKIIECSCLNKLHKKVVTIHYKNFELYSCKKVKIISIYDIPKDIIFKPIKTNFFKDSIKVGKILVSFKKRNIFFFKTFIEALLTNYKIDNIIYNIYYETVGYQFVYDNVKFRLTNYEIDNIIYNIYYEPDDYQFLYDNMIIRSINYKKSFSINKNGENTLKYYIIFSNKRIEFNEYINTNTYITYIIYNNYIEIIKNNYSCEQRILCYKDNLKIIESTEYNKNKILYREKINDNNETKTFIEYFKTYKIKEKFISNSSNPSFSKPLKKYCIELINHFDENINKYFKIINSILKKEKKICSNLLFNYYLELINSK